MFCNKCGNSIIEGERFCNKCGHNVDNSQVTQSNLNNQTVQPIPNTVYNNQMGNYQIPKKKNGWITALIVFGVIIVVLFIVGRLVLFFANKTILDHNGTINENNLEDKTLTSEIYGEWIYDETGGSYIFNKDGTYKFYLTSDHSDGYVNGTFDLRFGVLARSGATEYYKYWDSDGNKLYSLTTNPANNKLEGVEKTYKDGEGALQFVLTLYINDKDKMNIYNLLSEGNFEVIRK